MPETTPGGGGDLNRQPWHEQFEAAVRRSLPQLPDDQPLEIHDDLRSLGLTSMMIVTLILDLEGQYQIEFGEDTLLTDICTTPGRLWSELNSLIAQQTG